MSHFFAYMSRMKYIERWALMRNSYSENIQEHSLQVAMIAHHLALIKNQYFNGQVNPERIAVCAMFHDASEVITGDLPTPIKYFNPEISNAYKDIEHFATQKLLNMLPNDFAERYQSIFEMDNHTETHHIIKAADSLSAYLKCLEEIASGNTEFRQAKKALELKIKSYQLPEADYFIKTYVPSFSLTLDDLD